MKPGGEADALQTVRLAFSLRPQQAPRPPGAAVHPLREGGLFGLGHGAASGAVARPVEGCGVILVAEYIEHRQPEIWLILIRRYLCFVVDWQAIMTERPKPGRAGLLPGERVVNW